MPITDELGTYSRITHMVTPGLPRGTSRPGAKPESFCKACGLGKRGDGVGGPYHPGCEPGGYMERLRSRRGGNQDTRGIVMKATEKDTRPSPRQPLRRAQMDQHGNAITWTETGAIINGLEIEYTPTFSEASREIGTRQRRYMLEGVEAHEALSRALAEVHPVFKRAYTA